MLPSYNMTPCNRGLTVTLQTKLFSTYSSLLWRQITNCFRGEDRDRGEPWSRTAERDQEQFQAQTSAQVGSVALTTQYKQKQLNCNVIHITMP